MIQMNDAMFVKQVWCLQWWIQISHKVNLPKPSTGGSWPIFAKFSDRENICPGGRGKGVWGTGRDVNSAQRQVTF